MFVQVFIVQCRSSGKFLTSNLNYTTSLNRAGLLFTKQSAIDTGLMNLDFDFEVYDFYKKESELPVLAVSGSHGDPHR